ncbi:dihydrolipoamide succinyltransferase [Leptospira perolatii]|uniref:Dihydrolipoamide acetyltransferase component of pyruvate dehydrogenase complex n=1 Tax=Leptospira perolatii TaxID=2023191 RepID=A0A2M9ZJ92_9LEPT|nr:dihydrolipoamide acetyltransferase family protein [Leptospira perolatii]PJZ68436.1 dihydrolipoamide succinyltransferase [Leptospira perolatii]PJZ72135.1 dihydrolipoamide succinyltransferase [Leptospira perolatii]
MAKIAEMTQLSPTMSEGILIRWLKKKGDSVNPGESIAEVETDKAVMEMEAFDSGVLLEIIAPEGSKIPVGGPVAVIGKAGEDIASLLEEAKSRTPVVQQSSSEGNSAKTETSPSSAFASSVSEKKSISETKSSPANMEPAHSMRPDIETSGSFLTSDGPKQHQMNLGSQGLTQSAQEGRIKASPLAKRLATESGVDLAKISGTGPQGRILKRDIEASKSQLVPGRSSSTIAPILREEKLPISGMRSTIANRLVHAKTHQPHFYLEAEINALPLSNLREQFNSDLKSGKDEIKVSINDFLIRASALALLEVPQVNSSWREDHILRHGRVDIGVAVSIEGGLITPYVRNADRIGVLEISRTVKELASRARERKLKPEEYSNGTFTVSNLGMYGIDKFAAVINEPEAAILAIGAVVEKPVLVSGSIVPGKTLTVCLSCDHRVVDGAVGAAWLAVLRELIEHPLRLLA